MLSLFSCVCWPSVCLLWRRVYLGLLPIVWLGCLIFWYWAAWAICIFWRLIPCHLLNLRIFSSILFILFMVSLAMRKLLSLTGVHLVLFVFGCSGMWVLVRHVGLSETCEVLVRNVGFQFPNQRWNRCPLKWKHWTTREVPTFFFSEPLWQSGKLIDPFSK